VSCEPKSSLSPFSPQPAATSSVEDGSLLLTAPNAVGSVTISLLAALAGRLLGRAL
jgi:hypothetical protein